MKQVIDFLTQLERNNNREWFNAHKEEYRAAQQRFDKLAEQVIIGISTFDPSVAGLTAKDCTYRIYRDTRFSADKSPYKCHMGAFICPEGKKSGYAGYYLQVGPHEDGYPCGNMLAAGHYTFEPQVLRIIREDIANDPSAFGQLISQAKGFALDEEDKMKRVPRGFPADVPYAHYLMYRSYCLVASPGKDYMLTAHLGERIVEAFARTAPFIAFLNRAMAYACEDK